MKDAVVDYKIVNFDTYNPKRGSETKVRTWFRVQADLMDNSSIAQLDHKQFRIWFALLCKQCRSTDRAVLTMRTITAQAQTKQSVVTAALEKMQSLGMIDFKIFNENKKSSYERNERTNVTNEHTQTPLVGSEDPTPPASPKIIDKRPDEFFELWNANSGPLPKVTRLTQQRRAKIKIRLNEEPDFAYWLAAIRKMAASDFCVSGKWATFDWLIDNGNNHVKVSEGNYDNKGQKQQQSAISDDERAKLLADMDAMNANDPLERMRRKREGLAVK